MKDVEIQEQVKKKLFLLNSFLHTASLPSGGESDSALKHSVTVHFLQSVVMELIIKVFFELDCKKAAPFTHNLPKIYKNLSADTKSMLEEKFNEARKRREQQFAMISSDVVFHSLSDVLINNEKTVKNFKYDAMAVQFNSSADNAFYKEVIDYIKMKESRLIA